MVDRLRGLSRQEQAVLSNKDPDRYSSRSFERYRYFYYKPIRYRECPLHITGAPSAGKCMKCERGTQQTKTGPTGRTVFGEFTCSQFEMHAKRKKEYINPEDIPNIEAKGFKVHSEPSYR